MQSRLYCFSTATSVAYARACLVCVQKATASSWHWTHPVTPRKARSPFAGGGQVSGCRCASARLSSVTWWQQPGGVCRIDRTRLGGPGIEGKGVGRRDVQCEDCHGPGSHHVKDAAGAFIQREVPDSACMRCHEAANSPHFDDAKYRPYIIGPGHGQPLAKGEKARPRPGGPSHE